MTVPSPWPSAAEVIVTHADPLVALHEHSRGTVTVTVPVPPTASKTVDELATTVTQRPVAGATGVTEVKAELPHAAPAALMAAAASI